MNEGIGTQGLMLAEILVSDPHCNHPFGQEMRAKFVDCARRAIDEAAIQGVVEYVERLETLKDVGDLCALLAGEKR